MTESFTKTGEFVESANPPYNFLERWLGHRGGRYDHKDEDGNDYECDDQGDGEEDEDDEDDGYVKEGDENEGDSFEGECN